MSISVSIFSDSLLDADYVAKWDDMHGQTCSKVVLSTSCQEYEEVIKIFKKGGMVMYTSVSVCYSIICINNIHCDFK